MAKIKILLANINAVMRKGMKMLLEEEPNILIIGEILDGLDALAKIETLSPNIVILDPTISKMSGIDAVKHISLKFPLVKILVFSMHNDPNYISASNDLNSSRSVMARPYNTADFTRSKPPNTDAIAPARSRPKKRTYPQTCG